MLEKAAITADTADDMRSALLVPQAIARHFHAMPALTVAYTTG